MCIVSSQVVHLSRDHFISSMPDQPGSGAARGLGRSVRGSATPVRPTRSTRPRSTAVRPALGGPSVHLADVRWGSVRASCVGCASPASRGSGPPQSPSASYAPAGFSRAKGRLCASSAMRAEPRKRTGLAQRTASPAILGSNRMPPAQPVQTVPRRTFPCSGPAVSSARRRGLCRTSRVCAPTAHPGAVRTRTSQSASRAPATSTRR